MPIFWHLQGYGHHYFTDDAWYSLLPNDFTCHLLIHTAVVSFDESTGGSEVAINVSEGAGKLEVVLVLSKAVGQAVSVFIIAMEGSAKGLCKI